MGVNQYKWQVSKLMIDYQRITEATRKIIITWCSDLVQNPNAFGNHFPCFKACAMAAPYTAECPFRFAAAWQWTVLSTFSLDVLVALVKTIEIVFGIVCSQLLRLGKRRCLPLFRDPPGKCINLEFIQQKVQESTLYRNSKPLVNIDAPAARNE